MKIRCVVVCVNSEGAPDFFGCVLSVSEEACEDGNHYELARDRAEANGYEQPMLVFDEDEGPAWLFENVFGDQSDE